MGTYINNVKLKNGDIKIRVVQKRNGKVISFKHIGIAHNNGELNLFTKLAQDEINKHTLPIFQTKENKLKLVHKKSYSALLYDIFSNIYDKLGFDIIKDTVYKKLVIARIIEPTSKLDTIRVIKDLGLPSLSPTTVYKTMKVVYDLDYRSIISKKCIEYANIDNKSNVLYDVTTLYFEIQKEDGFRKSGFSKERRLEPQILVGLLVSENGFPLAVHSFEGNKAETLTILPVLKRFADIFGLTDITVVADAGMLSAQNLYELEQNGFSFIVGSRISKTPYEIDEYINNCKLLKDKQIFQGSKLMEYNGVIVNRRVIYQYRHKRYKLDISNIEKQVEKVKNVIYGDTSLKKARFLKIKGGRKVLDESLIEKAKKKAGIKGYVTNLQDMDPQMVIDHYHALFNVEKSFRMSKSDLKARPIFHHKFESIQSHITIVFTALAIARYVQDKTGISIKRFVDLIKPLRTAVVLINGQEYTAEPEVDEKAKLVISLVK
jgi:transposase